MVEVEVGTNLLTATGITTLMLPFVFVFVFVLVAIVGQARDFVRVRIKLSCRADQNKPR